MVLRQAALLVLLATPARARIVTAHRLALGGERKQMWFVPKAVLVVVVLFQIVVFVPLLVFLRLPEVVPNSISLVVVPAKVVLERLVVPLGAGVEPDRL